MICNNKKKLLNKVLSRYLFKYKGQFNNFFIIFFLLICIPNKLFSQSYQPGDFLEKTLWHQNNPYNNSTPKEIENGIEKHTLVGCSGLALGQIFNYYEHPTNVQGINYTINYNNIPNAIPENNNIITTLSNFLLVTGIAMGSDYGINETSAKAFAWTRSGDGWKPKIKSVLSENGYDSEKLAILERLWYNDDEWADIIKDEIDNCRIIFFYGKNNTKWWPNGGHYFIIDGYRYSNSNGKFEVHADLGRGREIYDNWYEVDNILTYTEDIKIVTGIHPIGKSNFCNHRSNAKENPDREQSSEVSSRNKQTLPCPQLFSPYSGKDNVSDFPDITWEDVVGAIGYYVSVRAVQSNITYLDRYETYAGISSVRVPDFLPPNETIEVIIEPFDKDGNSTICSPKFFSTSSNVCRTALENIETWCGDIGPEYYIEVDFAGINGRTYDLYAELNGNTYSSKGSISPGKHILGPISLGQDVAIIVEDKSQPTDCNDAVYLQAPICPTCSDVTITSTSTDCNTSSYSTSVTISGESGYLYNINAGPYGTRKDKVASGTYTITDIPNGQNVTIFVQEDGAENYCLVTDFVIAPSCSTTSCNLIEITNQSPNNGARYPIGSQATLSWSINSNSNCLESFELQLSNNYEFTDPLSYSRIPQTAQLNINGVGITYWRVRAKNVDGDWGSWSSIKNIVGYNPNPPNNCDAAENLWVSSIEYYNANCRWNVVENASSYKVTIYKNGTEVNNYNSTNNIQYVSGLQSNTEYCFTVKTTCITGEISISSQKCFTTQQEEIEGCTDNNAHNYNPAATSDNGSCQTCNDGVKNGDETQIDCGGSICEACLGQCEENWTVTNSMLTVELFEAEKVVKTSGNILLTNSKNLVFEGEQIDIYDGFNMEPGAFFEAKIDPCALDGNLTSEPEEIQVAKERTKTDTSVQPVLLSRDIPCNNSLSIFPNPSKGATNIEYALQEATSIHIVLHDINGTLIKEIEQIKWQGQGVHTTSFDVSAIVKGIYTCTMINANCKVVQKLVIQ